MRDGLVKGGTTRPLPGRPEDCHVPPVVDLGGNTTLYKDLESVREEEDPNGSRGWDKGRNGLPGWSNPLVTGGVEGGVDPRGGRRLPRHRYHPTPLPAPPFGDTTSGRVSGRVAHASPPLFLG